MSIRWSTALFGGALLLAFSNQMLGRACYQAAPGVPSPAATVGDVVAARYELDRYLSCVDTLASRPLPPVDGQADPEAASSTEPLPVQLYRRACGARLGNSEFADYERRYGTAALAVVRSLADAELAAAAQFLLTPRADAVAADPVWMAAFGRIAARTRGFHADLLSALAAAPTPASAAADR